MPRGYLPNGTPVARKHGQKGTPLYRLWLSIRIRCTQPSAINYAAYKDRWHAPWDDFMAFYHDVMSTIGPRPLRMTIDRPNNRKPYGPNNIRWATTTAQNRNKSDTKITMVKARRIRKLARTMPQKDIAKRYGVSRSTICLIVNNKQWVE